MPESHFSVKWSGNCNFWFFFFFFFTSVGIFKKQRSVYTLNLGVRVRSRLCNSHKQTRRLKNHTHTFENHWTDLLENNTVSPWVLEMLTTPGCWKKCSSGCEAVTPVGRDDIMRDVKGVARRDEPSQNYQAQTFSSIFLLHFWFFRGLWQLLCSDELPLL